ncbi:cobalt ECF transporter T component CbiQ [Mesoterricola silvestris]|uniref:Cobalt ECF transporter T component CbiQ n=1 Tax=Mesoterricola silvestris TaxID=2927979 RepID=A0AA48KAA8_9BACT|nr:cobalt ECF transporter T component CbiQ [Mesoterricola silvestris]BDU73117.1 cobalt ECF transporter T component CbiQ [Mesoterricola silvestris]
MSALASLIPFGTLDELAAADSPVHRLDPRAKLLATALFIVAVASFGRYEVAALAPFALYPAALMALGGIPAGFILSRMLAALPFVLLLAALNPVLDRAPLLTLGPVAISGGWVSFASILMRFALTVGAALVLVATTSMDGVCLGLERLGAPRAFAQQVAFLHRYAFVLGAEALRIHRARTLRAFGGKLTPGEFATLAGNLLLRAWDRARRIHVAMLTRGFTGRFPEPRPLAWGTRDLLFTVLCAAAFAALRVWNLPRILGGLLAGGAP